MLIKIQWVIILGLIIWLVISLLTRPPSKIVTEREMAYKYQVAILQGKLDSVNNSGKAIVKKTHERRGKDSTQLKAQESKIKALEALALKKRTPRVDSILIDNPDLLSFVETQQEIIQEFKAEVDTLKSQLAFSHKMFDELVVNEDAEDRIEQDLRELDKNRITDLEKLVKKERRGKKFWRTLSFIFGGAGFYAGSKS